MKGEKKMEEIKAYRTTDGKTFFDKEAAIRHQDELDGLKIYGITLHYVGSYELCVKAKNEAEALRKARGELSPYPEEIDFDEVEDKVEVELYNADK